MISDEELDAMEERAGEDRVLEDIYALVEEVRQLRTHLQTAMGALADIGQMKDSEVAQDIPRKKAQRIYNSLPKL